MTQAHKHGNTFPYYVVKLFFFNLFSKDHVSQERVLHMKNSTKRFIYIYIYIYIYQCIFNLLHNRRFNECVGRHDFLNNDI